MCVMHVIDRKPVNVDNDDDHHIKLIHRQSKNDTKNDASQVFVSIPIGLTVAVQWEDGGLWTHGKILGRVITITTTGHITYKLQ